MQIPVLFGCLIIFILWLHYELRKSKKYTKQQQELFWKREQESNAIRRVDLSDLEYIRLNLGVLPMDNHDDAAINDYRDTIRMLSDKRILNLAGLTNTELKMKYGTANINALSEYDNNYTLLVRTLQKWGERYYTLGFTKEATIILEYAVLSFTDISKTYMLLADIYKKENSLLKIDDLITIIPHTKVMNQEKLIHTLKDIKNSKG